MLYFSRWKALATLLTALVVCLFAVPNFFPRSDPQVAGRRGRSATSCSGSTCRAARISCSRSTSTTCASRRPRQLRDDVRSALRDARVGYTGLADPRSDRRGAHPRGKRFRRGARPSCANCPSRSADLLSATGQRSVDVVDAGNRRDPAHHHAARHHRARAPGGRAGDPDRRAPHQRDRHGRAADPAPGRRPHSGAGAGLSTIRRASSTFSAGPRS